MLTSVAPALLLALVACSLPSTGLAQAAPAPAQEIVRVMDSGPVRNDSDQRRVLAQFSVEEPGALWLRLQFEQLDLGGNSYVRISSMLDGASQVLHAEQALHWGNSSAYFNGDALLVELIGEPHTGASQMRLRGFQAGFAALNSICGAQDDRVLSADPRVGRALPVGCTAWMINDCGHCFLTAGHCLVGNNLSVVQFQVPLSTSSGGLQHPPPEHQYAVDISSTQFVNGGTGNDWGYFGCYPNSNTGLTPFEAQRAAFVIAAPPSFNPAWNLRVSGYGTDSSPSEWNQVQQTDVGPYLSLSASVVRHLADTTGGSSGAAVQWVEGGVAIAIHTHAGCNSTESSGNAGTSISQAGLQAALANPLGVCNSPCSASLEPYCEAKLNSLGCAPTIGAVGLPSVSSTAPFLITASNVLNQKFGLLIYSCMSAATPFQGGTLCLASPWVRTSMQSSGGDVGTNNCSGSHSFDFRARIQSGIDPNLRAGTTIYAQWLTRDLASPSGPLGLTAGLAITIGS